MSMFAPEAVLEANLFVLEPGLEAVTAALACMEALHLDVVAVRMALRLIELCPACELTIFYVIDKLVLNELVRFSSHGEKEVEAELEEQGQRYLDLAHKDAERQGVKAQCETRKGIRSKRLSQWPTISALTSFSWGTRDGVERRAY